MEETILDGEIAIKNDGRKGIISGWIALIILWIGIFFCIQNGLLKNIPVAVTIVLLIINSITTYKKPEYGIKLTSVLLILGIMGLLRFFPSQNFIRFGFGTLVIQLEVFLLLIAILHCFINRKIFSPVISKVFKVKLSELELLARERSEINGFKNHFSSKTKEELITITNNDKLLPEAIKAARELLEENYN